MLGVAVATGIVFGLVPAIQASRSDLAATLRASRGSRAGAGAGVRRVLVVAQVALSLTLLVAAGLCVRTLLNASAIDTGYDVHRVLTARLDLAKQRYEDARGRAFQSELIERLRARPGIDAAGFAVTLPLNDGRWEDAIRRAGDPTRFQTFRNVVSAGYFDAMKIPLVAGRVFAGTDGQDAPRVAIVNQRLAQLLWPGENPIGKVVDFDRRPHEVIGLARDIKGRDLFEPPGPMLYQSIAQAYSAAVVLHVRAALPAAVVTSLVREEVGALDRGLPIYGVKMLDEHVTAALTPQRLLAWLISGFGVLALALTAIGLYGLLSYTVTQRTPEIGIRMALGASSDRVVGIFLGDGLKMLLIGVGAGIGGAVFLTRLMRGVLYGVSPGDPLAFVTGALILIGVGLLACYLPARRAARADPNVALRCD
jgi:predicted permease